MHKVHLNDVQIEVWFKPRAAFLVKGPDKGSDPGRPDLTPMRTWMDTGDGMVETVFIPGSSIKGVVRSAAERVLRTVAPEGQRDRWACDPLNHKGACQKEASDLGDRIARKGGEGPYPMAAVHKKVCLACRTFGSQAIRSRVSFADALPSPKYVSRANQTLARSGVAIDRKTGGPARGKLFQVEVVPGGNFRTRIHLDNVQMWQVALLGLVLEDIDAGLVRMGSAKTRGLGEFEVSLRAVTFRQLGGSAPAGVGALAPDMVEPYGLIPEEALPEVPGGAEAFRRGPFQGWRWSYAKDDKRAAWALFEAAWGAPWERFVARAAGAL